MTGMWMPFKQLGNVMPARKNSSNTTRRKIRASDAEVSVEMLDRALNSVMRRVRIDRRHDVPYLAGYSKDGKTIYIDRRLPEHFTYRGRQVSTSRYLVLHESVEKVLIDELSLHYQHAHQIATQAEEAAVRADKVSWKTYERFMQRYVEKAEQEPLTRVPPDLDLTPYRDEHDEARLARLQSAQGNSSVGGSRKKLVRKKAGKRREKR